MYIKVAVYIRKSGTREYEKASPKANYPVATIFCLRREFKLHKFRKTYATLQHRDGVDTRTIEKRLGHSGLSTTLAYLEGEDVRSERSRQQVNGTFAVFAKTECNLFPSSGSIQKNQLANLQDALGFDPLLGKGCLRRCKHHQCEVGDCRNQACVP